jgi:undecaprenyl-diphosphatase
VAVQYSPDRACGIDQAVFTGSAVQLLLDVKMPAGRGFGGLDRTVHAALLISAAVFGLLLAAVESGLAGHGSVDARVDSTAHRFVLSHPAVLDAARMLTRLGAPTVVTVVTLVAAAVLVVLGRCRAALFVGAVRIATQLADSAVKDLVARPRPKFAHPVDHASGWSFPSGHAAGAASVYLPLAVVACALWAARSVRVVAWSLAVPACLAVASSRVLLGVHHPSDVIAGLALGVALTAAATPLLGGGLKVCAQRR